MLLCVSAASLKVVGTEQPAGRNPPTVAGKTGEHVSQRRGRGAGKQKCSTMHDDNKRDADGLAHVVRRHV